MKQKFKRGNLVLIAKNLGSAMSHFRSGVKAIVENSYADEFGGTDTKSYAVRFPDTGGYSAWYYEHQLRLIDKGGEHLIKKALRKSAAIKRKHRDIRYIVRNLETENLSSISVLFLFDLIGHKSKFLQNGEYYTLHDGWFKLYPFFVFIKHAKTLKEAKSIFTQEALKIYKIKDVYIAFKKALK